jgi:hypothetical protein
LGILDLEIEYRTSTSTVFTFWSEFIKEFGTLKYLSVYQNPLLSRTWQDRPV